MANGLMDSCPATLLVLSPPLRVLSTFVHRSQTRDKTPFLDATVPSDMDLNSLTFYDFPSIDAAPLVSAKMHLPNAIITKVRNMDYSEPHVGNHLVHIL